MEENIKIYVHEYLVTIKIYYADKCFVKVQHRHGGRPADRLAEGDRGETRPQPADIHFDSSFDSKM